VLATLRRSGAPYRMTPTTLYRELVLSSGAMTNRLDALERAGLVEKWVAQLSMEAQKYLVDLKKLLIALESESEGT
jgi:DNA-binding MarR family transcriptional regulator